MSEILKSIFLHFSFILFMGLSLFITFYLLALNRKKNEKYSILLIFPIVWLGKLILLIPIITITLLSEV